MFTVKPNDAILGATIEGLDASKPVEEAVFARLLVELGRFGVLRFPGQDLSPEQLRVFSERFGDIQGSISERAAKAETPEVGILSNIKEGGAYIGAPDAGQSWHTDMSYRDVMGFVNVLFGIRIPRRDGQPLGGTEFSNMHRAYEDLPAEIKTRLADTTATHDFNKFWEMMRRDKGSERPALTEEQRRRRPPSVHPVFLTHPITGRKTLYCNPGYATRINELPEAESEEMLRFLFAHQLQPKYRWTHRWTENDLLVWDNLGTIHQAIADYRPDEIRLMRRCQVMATKIFEPEFLRPVRAMQNAA
jgi:taurine dioxygenase